MVVDVIRRERPQAVVGGPAKSEESNSCDGDDKRSLQVLSR